VIVFVEKRRATCPECHGGGNFAHDSVGCAYSEWQFQIEPKDPILVMGRGLKIDPLWSAASWTWNDLQPNDQIRIDVPGMLSHHPRRVLHGIVTEVTRKSRFLRSPLVTWVKVRPIEEPEIRSVPAPPPPLPTSWTHILEDDDFGG
jgi:hypothetical protein